MRAEGNFRDTLYTINKRGDRKWVYAHFLSGWFFKRRKIVGYFLMALYLSMPWLVINGEQAVRLDIAHRRFVFFGLELWATDTIYLFLTLAILGMSLFFFTSIFGRIWCGWACPETIFLELLFRPIERFIEGNESMRRKLDAAPWSTRKIFKKLLKHLLCAFCSWILASTALAYFLGREPLLNMIASNPLLNPVPFSLTMALMGLMAFQFGWFREQFCTILCPYARFQSVLMDQNSLLVGYDYNRGEPRGKLRSDKASGDCIDCGLCVRVCPTGIDIRNGTQLECVACTACIDACDSIMAKIQKPAGLIKYTTEHNLKAQVPAYHAKVLLRPRVIIYVAILSVLITTMIYKVSTRSPLDIEIVRVAQLAPFTVDSNQIVTNQFSLRLANKGYETASFNMEVREPDNISLRTPLSQISLNHGQSEMVPVFIQAPLTSFKNGQIKILVIIESNNHEKVERELILIGPDN